MSRRAGPGGGRASGSSLARGVALIVLGVVVGVVVLHSLGSSSPPAASTSQVSAPAPSAPPAPSTAPTTAPARTTTTTASPLRPPSQVLTQVANGTSVSGLAGRITSALQQAGYNVLSPADATSQVSSSAVYYTPGYAREAAAVASFLGLPSSVVQPYSSSVPISSTRGAEVIVIAGNDLARQNSGPSTGSATPSTTTANH
jgi:hypothetical protein